MSRFKRRQEKGKYFLTHHFLFVLTLPETDRESSFCLSLRCNSPPLLSCELSRTCLALGKGESDDIIDKIFLDLGAARWVACQLLYPHVAFLPLSKSFRWEIMQQIIIENKIITCLFSFFSSPTHSSYVDLSLAMYNRET